MDYVTPMLGALKGFWWIIPLVFLIGLFKTPWWKGILGEALVKLAANRLPKDTYHALHNVTLPTPDGTTQIDHIFVSRYGIFVVETKNYKGWIFGGEHQAQWTQKLYKKNFKFQNPLRQNHKHLKALEAALDIPPETLHSIVVFAGESTFKTPMPANVTRGGGYVTYIKSFKDVVLTEAQVKSAFDQISAGRLTPSRATNRQHVEHLKSRSDPNAERKCPKCGSAMVLRTSKRGGNVGQKFWGCSAFPKCRTMQKVD